MNIYQRLGAMVVEAMQTHWDDVSALAREIQVTLDQEGRPIPKALAMEAALMRNRWPTDLTSVIAMSEEFRQMVRDGNVNMAAGTAAKLSAAWHTAGPAPARWVRTDERNPDKDGRLWAILTERRENGKHTGYLTQYEYYHFIDGWATDDHVTHWLDADLPLPGVPK